MYTTIYKGYYIVCENYYLDRLIYKIVPMKQGAELVAIADSMQEAFRIIDGIENELKINKNKNVCF